MFFKWSRVSCFQRDCIFANTHDILQYDRCSIIFWFLYDKSARDEVVGKIIELVVVFWHHKISCPEKDRILHILTIFNNIIVQSFVNNMFLPKRIFEGILKRIDKVKPYFIYKNRRKNVKIKNYIKFFGRKIYRIVFQYNTYSATMNNKILFIYLLQIDSALLTICCTYFFPFAL